MVSAVPATENNFWIDRQKRINHGFVMGFERQKDRLTNIETDIEDLWGNFTGNAALDFNDHSIVQNSVSLNSFKIKQMKTVTYVKK